MSHLANGPSGTAPFYVAPDSENESLKSLALSEAFMWIALWILGPTEKTFSRRPYNSFCNRSEMKSGISFMPSLIPKSSLRGDITRNTFNSVKENIFTVGKHSLHLVTNICPRPVLPCWYCVGRLGENNQLVLAGSATLMCGKPGILKLSIGIDYVCGSLCLWIDTIRLKWWGRKEARRRSSQLREWVCVREAHEKGKALWALASPFLITLTHLLSVQGNRETRERSSQAKVLGNPKWDTRIDGSYSNYGHFYFLGLIFFSTFIHSFFKSTFIIWRSH